MLYIVAAEDGIHTTTANFAHIGQGADNMGVSHLLHKMEF
jgi:hypothetical protein